MRYLFIISSLCILFSCAKQRMVNRLEGRWNFTKMLLNDGSYVTHSEVYEFSGGDKSDSDLPFVIYGQDTTYGTYRIAKKSIVKVTDSATETEIDWLVEDMDENSLVFRIAEGVVFLEKQ